MGRSTGRTLSAPPAEGAPLFLCWLGVPPHPPSARPLPQPPIPSSLHGSVAARRPVEQPRGGRGAPWGAWRGSAARRCARARCLLFRGGWGLFFSPPPPPAPPPGPPPLCLAAGAAASRPLPTAVGHPRRRVVLRRVAAVRWGGGRSGSVGRRAAPWRDAGGGGGGVGGRRAHLTPSLPLAVAVRGLALVEWHGWSGVGVPLGIACGGGGGEAPACVAVPAGGLSRTG